jgi:photosystem II stability/assembly factor-like uncharacterized protein
MRKYIFAMIVASSILFTVSGLFSHGQVRADSSSAYQESTAGTGLSGLSTSNGDTWTTGGPYGGYVNSLAMAATSPDVIYAGTESGVFKTTDGADTWTHVGLSGTLVRVVQVAPLDSNTVYAGTDDGLYKSEDGGSNWVQEGLPGARVNAIAIDPLDPDVLYAGTGWPLWTITGEVVGIFKSTDGGDTWESKYDNGLDAVMTLLIDTNDSLSIYAGVRNDLGDWRGLRKSTDGGETWVSMQVGGVWPEKVVALAMTPGGSNPPAIYAVGNDDVFKSTDSGENWTPTNTPWISPSSPWALAVDPNNPNVIYVGTWYYQGHLYKSTDGADTWLVKANGLPPGGPSSIVVDPRNSAVYVGLSEGGVYESTNEAENWNFSSQGMSNTFIESLAIHPASDTAFAAINGEGHYLARTANKGTSWDYLVGSPTNLGAVAIDPQNPSTLFVGDGYDYTYVAHINKSEDGGQSWTSSSLGWYSEGAYREVHDIWVHPSDSNIVLAAASSSSNGGGVFRSADGGAFFYQTYDFWRVTTLASDPTDPNIVYCGTEQSGYVLRSNNTGDSGNWTLISPVGTWVAEVRDIEVDLNSSVYAATEQGLRKWDGSDWTELAGLPTDDITALAIDRSTNPGILYAGTGENGVFASEDGGITWTSFSEGLGNLSITKLAISASRPKMLHAGTSYGGVWSRMIGSTYFIYLPIVVKE